VVKLAVKMRIFPLPSNYCLSLPNQKSEESLEVVTMLMLRKVQKQERRREVGLARDIIYEKNYSVKEFLHEPSWAPISVRSKFGDVSALKADGLW
jgi:hypothetical protein